MQDFRKLRVWHESLALADRIHDLVEKFPHPHRFGIGDQFQRAADSVPSNIAEGCGRSTQRDKIHFWHIALGSVNEVDSILQGVRRLGPIKPVYPELLKQVIDVRKMLVSLIITAKQSPDGKR